MVKTCIQGKRYISLTAALLLVLSLAGCGTSEKKETANEKASDKPVTLKYPVYSDGDYEYFTNKGNLVEAYKKVRPNVTIEIERIKNSDEFDRVIKIRRAANELPDIMSVKVGYINSYKDMLLPLSDTEAAKNNKFAKDYAIDGQIYGIPAKLGKEFVYYKKSIFKELGLSIPKSWPEFVDLAKKIRDDGKYIPIAIGGKDSWAVYPFTEYMPQTVSGNGRLLDELASQDEPFSKDKPFYKAFAMINDLFRENVFGKDPLGIGNDQARALFVANKAAMYPSGSFSLPSLNKDTNNDLSDIGAFYMPVNMEGDVTNTIILPDMFLAAAKDGKNQEEAKAFINWFMSKQYYLDYLVFSQTSSTVNGIDADMPFYKSIDNQDKAKFITFYGGGDNFKKISDSVKFDVKRMGQEMLAGKSFDSILDALNKSWKDARTKIK